MELQNKGTLSFPGEPGSGYFIVAMLSMGFTAPLGGDGAKLALANVAQLVLIAHAFSTRTSCINDLLLVSFVAISQLISGLYAYLVLGVEPRLLVYFYFVASLVFFVQYRQALHASGAVRGKFAAAARLSILLLLPIYAGLAAYQYTNHGVMGVSYGADDKSHAAIFMAFQAFVALLVFKRSGYIFASILMLLSAMTISRLPYVFAPFVVLAMLVKIKRESKSAKELVISFGVATAILFCIVAVIIYYGEMFASLERLSSILERNAEPNASTVAHNLLLQLGSALKFQSFGNFFFGISPGSFGEALIASGVDYSALEAIDPQFIEFARLAKAPIHSTHMALFAEFPIWIFVIYVCANVIILYRLFKWRNWTLFLYFVPFNVAVLYYSAHNKAYYFLVLALVSIDFYERRLSPERVRNDDPA